VSAGLVVPVIIEAGKRRTFAQAVGWPGWCRSGKGEDAAIGALAAYLERYRVAMGELAAGLGSGTPR
jgi:hypothetical protein